ncbi:hypothetical protein QFC24_005885 [Naganishia onofrii]|uniref:Uncharacterized protein n=1 Tax=Naganishia onofrii TaxID=1851511 RepID=A0ACC2X677_9TREE|nr:hypothetical protein QFC24_005885 [Naganishia onofrii]
MALAIVQMNTWTWSAVFHTRDTPFTEKMDYFSATATIMFTVHYTILRLFNLFPYPPQRQQTPRIRYLLSITCILLYIAHISYLLSTPRFDYAWNILFNLCLGAVHLALWSIFSLRFTVKLPFPLSLIPTPYPPLDPLQITPKPQYSKTSALLVLGTTLAMSLELFDFPPIGRTIDAHSLWHLATVMIARGWYEFMIRDAAMLEAARMTWDPVAAGRVAEKMAEVVAGGREKGAGIMHGQQQQQQQQNQSRHSGGYLR